MSDNMEGAVNGNPDDAMDDAAVGKKEIIPRTSVSDSVQSPLGAPGVFQMYYRSTILSDIVLILPAEHTGGSKFRFPAHKLVLSVGSVAFKEYFQENPEVRELDVLELPKLSVLNPPSQYTLRCAVAYLYGIGLTTTKSQDTVNCCYLCEAAEALGIPVLRDSMLKIVEKRLEQELAIGADDGGVSMYTMDRIMGRADMFDEANCGQPATTRLATKLFCKYYRDLEHNERFRDYAGGRLSMYKRMVEYVAEQRDGNLL
ncbi:hypothetical protein Q7P37_002093 [Cladosporium fusiforme]